MLAEQLRFARERAGLSIYGLAHASGVGVATISEIESNTTPNPGVLTLVKLADVLHVSLDMLMARILPDDPKPRARRKRESTTE